MSTMELKDDEFNIERFVGRASMMLWDFGDNISCDEVKSYSEFLEAFIKFAREQEVE